MDRIPKIYDTIQKHLIVDSIWTIWVVGMGQNTRTMSLNDLPNIPVISEMAVFWLHSYIIGILVKFDKTTSSTKSCTSSSSFQKRHGQNDRRKRGHIYFLCQKLGSLLQKLINSVFFREPPPYLSIYGLNNSFLHEQLLWQSVLIFSYL